MEYVRGFHSHTTYLYIYNEHVQCAYYLSLRINIHACSCNVCTPRYVYVEQHSCTAQAAYVYIHVITQHNYNMHAQ